MKSKKQIILYSAAALLLVTLVVMSNITRRNASVRHIQAEIDYCGSDTLISHTTLENWLIQQLPTLTGQQIKEVHTDTLLHVLQNNPYLASCHVSTTVGGDINIQAVQRVPILHLFYGSREFYLDREGNYLPLGTEGMTNVVVGNGYFNVKLPTPLDSLTLSQMQQSRNFRLLSLYNVALYLHDNPSVGILFDQIYMDENGDILLVPKVGNHIVTLGDDSDLDRKFYDLQAFYREGFGRVGWNSYKHLSVKYKDQIIGTRSTKR